MDPIGIPTKQVVGKTSDTSLQTLQNRALVIWSKVSRFLYFWQLAVVGIFQYMASNFYLKSLAGGDLEWIHYHLMELGNCMIYAVIFFCAAFICAFTIPYWHMRLFSMGSVAVVQMLLFLSDRGENFQNHGAYNMILFLIMALTILGIYLLLHLFYSISSRKDLFWTILVIIGFSTMTIVHIRLNHYRNIWGDGLLGKKLHQAASMCSFDNPRNTPYIDLLPDGIQNFWTGSQTCPDQEFHVLAEIDSTGVLTMDCGVHGNPTYTILPDTIPMSGRLKNETILPQAVRNHSISRVYTEPILLSQDQESILVRCGNVTELRLNLQVSNRVRQHLSQLICPKSLNAHQMDLRSAPPNGDKSIHSPEPSKKRYEANEMDKDVKCTTTSKLIIDDLFKEDSMQDAKLKMNATKHEILHSFIGEEDKVHSNEARTNTQNCSNDLSDSKRPVNVLILFFDAVSRRHMLRRLPKAMSFLERLHTPSDVPHPEKPSDGHSRLYQFFRYQVVSFNTEGNTKILYRGVKDGNNSPLQTIAEQAFLGKFHDKSRFYMVALAETDCYDWATWFSGRAASMTSYDHEFLAPLCDSSYIKLDNHYGLARGPNSYLRRCLYDRYVHRHTFDYMLGLQKVYKSQAPNVPWLMFGNFAEGHDVTGEVLKTVDDDLKTFLVQMVADGTINDTALFLVSDHGLHIGINYLYTNNGRAEHANPAFFALLPERILTPEIIKNLEHNEQALMTGYNIHHTWKDILGLTGADPKLSLLQTRLPLDATCKDANIEEMYCRCK